jgi:vacuolar-type H+-ATPase subunit H
MGVIIGSMIALIIIVFIGLVIFMQKVFNKEVVSATSHLDELTAEYAKREEALKKQYEDAKRQSQEIIANAQKDAQQQRDQVLKEAHDEKNKILDEAAKKTDEMVRQADNARLALLAEVDKKIEERAIVKAVELLGICLSEDFRRQMHESWVQELTQAGFQVLDRLRVPDQIQSIKVVTAFALTEGQRKALVLKIKERLGYEVAIEEEIDPKIIAGISVNVGSLYLDGSLKFKIEEEARAKQSGS